MITTCITIETTEGVLTLPPLDAPNFPTAAPGRGVTDWSQIAGALARKFNRTIEQSEVFLANRRRLLGDYQALQAAEAAMTKAFPLRPADAEAWQFVEPAWYRVRKAEKAGAQI